MKFGIRHKIFVLIMGMSLVLGGLFVVSSMVKMRTGMKKIDVFRQHEAIVIGRFLDASFNRQADLTRDPYAQQLIDHIKSADKKIKRISIHARAPEGESPSGYWFLASTKRARIGLPSEPEVLAVIQSRQDIYRQEASSEAEAAGELTMDLTSPLLDLDNNIIGVAGITLIYEAHAGEKPELQFEHTKDRAKAIANLLDAAILSIKKLSRECPAQREVDAIVQQTPYISRLSIHARAPEGKSPSGYWFLASTAPEKVGLPSDPEDIESIREDRHKILFEEDENGKRFIDVTYPLHDFDGRAIATAGITIDLGAEDAFLAIAQEKEVKEMILFLMAILGTGIIFSLWFSAYYSQMITAPIKEYVEAARDIAQGNLDRKVVISSQDEIGEFAEVFNSMAVSLKMTNESLEERAEQRARELLASEERFKALFNAAGDCIFILEVQAGPEPVIIDVNEAARTLYGYSKKEMEGMLPSDLYASNAKEAIRQGLENLLVDGKKMSFAAHHRKKDGTIFPIEVTARLVEVDGKRLVLAIGRDITERQEAEDNLRAARKQAEDEKAKTEDLINSLPDGIIIQDLDYKVMFENAAQQIAVGHHIGEYCYKAYANNDKLCGHCPMVHSLKDGKVHKVEVEVPVGAEIRAFELTSSPLRDSDGEIIGGIKVVRDITEQRKLESQISRSQKMKALGTLTGGIAHEFNNIMSGVIGFGELLVLQLEKGSTARRYADRIITSANRADKLTAGLLAYSRKGTVRMATLEVNEVIEAVHVLLANMVGEKINLVINTSDEALTIKADKSQLEQVLVNLASNAVWVMPAGGILTIKAGITEFDKPYRTTRLKIKPGKYVHLSVEDTGSGMSPEVQEKLFEPFFTTKDVGDGTGLGLAMVYGTIRRHNGHIGVKSTLGEGTVFDLYLPFITDKVARKNVHISSPVVRGQETLLVAEDDETVREFTKELLSDAGYKILVAADGKEAVDIFIDNRDDIQLLLFDIGMPKKSGKEAFDEIKKLAPNVKVVFISGYGEDNAHLAAAGNEGYQLIQKPVKTNTLMQAIRAELDKPK